MGAFENGWLPGVMLSKLELSEEASSAFEVTKETFFAIGASGRTGCDFSTLAAGVEASAEATAGVVRSLLALEEFGKAVTQQSSAIAAKTMKHPSGRRRKDAQYAATTTTLLYFGTGVTGPMVTFFTGTFPAPKPLPSPGTLVLTRYSSYNLCPQLLL
jgi:hypothetical protein